MPPDEESQPLVWLDDFCEDDALEEGVALAMTWASLVWSASSSRSGGTPARRVASPPGSEAVWHRGQTVSPALSGVAHSGQVGTEAL